MYLTRNRKRVLEMEQKLELELEMESVIDEIIDEIKEEIKDEIIDEIIEEIKDEIIEEIIDEIKEEIKDDNIYCLICWEPEDKLTNPITKMQTIYLYNYTCECDCNFHPNCFLEWASKTHTCPICRKSLTVNMDIYYQLTLGNHYKLKLFCKKIKDCIVTVIYFQLRYLSLMWITYVSFWVLYTIYHSIQ